MASFAERSQGAAGSAQEAKTLKSNVFQRAIARHDLLEHFAYLEEKAGVEIAERFLVNAEVSFNKLAIHPTMGVALGFRHPDLRK